MSALPMHGRSVQNAASRFAPRLAALAGLLLVGLGATAGAQSATQLVRFRVVAQSRAEAAPVAKPLSAKSGAATSSLTLSTNDANLKVTASIDRRMPAGTSLSLAVANGAGANGADVQQLGTQATDVLTGLSPADGARIPVAYRVSSDDNGAAYAGEQRVVTYTVIGAP